MTSEEKKQWVKWFVDFLNADIQKFSPMEEGRMAGIVSIILMSQAYQGKSPPGSLVFEDGTTDMNAVRLYRSYWKATGSFMEMNILSIQNHLKTFFKNLMESIQELPDGVRNCESAAISLPITIIPQTQPPDLGSKQESPQTELPLSFLFRGSSQKDTVLLFFIRVLEGIPLRSFGACAECGRWFIQLSHKKKRFCSPRCAARSGMREGRQRKRIEASTDENRRIEIEEELRKKSERAHEAYVERVKKTRANAKVQRRPTKHRKED